MAGAVTTWARMLRRPRLLLIRAQRRWASTESAHLFTPDSLERWHFGMVDSSGGSVVLFSQLQVELRFADVVRFTLSMVKF